MGERFAPRSLVLWCADWPVVAAGFPADQPAAVLHANRVVACSAGARAEGVHRGLRRREAEARCPGLAVVERDGSRDARAFEPVVAAVERFAPRVEVTRAGLCAVATRGPARYFGGEMPLAARVVAAATEVLAGLDVHVAAGVADGAYAAALAARVVTTGPPPAAERPGDGTERVACIAPGESASFLAPLPVAALELHPDLARLLVRLGLRTVGQVAALPEADLVARFGPDGGVAWRRANAFDERPLDAREPPPDLVASVRLDPPAERVDQAAFAARALAADLGRRLGDLGLACTRLRIEAEAEHGESLSRLWRHDGPFTEGAVAERVRWQLDGWLTAAGPLSGGLTLLRLVPDEVVPGTGRQLGFWGGDAEADERAARALARLQGLLGPDAVVTAVVSGGRSAAEQVTLVPWGEPREPARPGPASGPVSGPRGKEPPPPWPGRVPGPPPALVPGGAAGCPGTVAVHDATGRPVAVSGRGLASAPPARVAVEGRWADVAAWAGPWVLEERWWDPERARRAARLQVVTADGAAHLLLCERGEWSVEATYD